MSKFFDKIAPHIPYTEPFLFVDDIIEASENYILGEYTYRNDAFFYKGHFKNNPITPGVILLETMGQIGLVCFAIYLNNYELKRLPLLSYINSELYKTVYPEEKVIVHSKKIYFRSNILKCQINMTNESEDQIANLEAILKLNQDG